MWRFQPAEPREIFTAYLADRRMIEVPPALYGRDVPRGEAFADEPGA